MVLEEVGMSTVNVAVPALRMSREEKRVVFASSLGTVFEWYDFFLAGSLATFISKHIFSGVNPTAGFIFTLLGSARGFQRSVRHGSRGRPGA